MRHPIAGLVFVFLFLGTSCAAARGDGSTVCMSGRQGSYVIAVFSAPTPLRAGPIDISVLVQDARSGEPVTEAQVTVRLTMPEQPPLSVAATQEAATNKLLRAASIDLPSAGRWHLDVDVDGPHGAAVISCDLDAANRLPKWRELWPWVCWPALVILLFGLHQALVRRSAGPGKHAGRNDDP
jgi:hypothetical protein